jgi:hypothetical protein
MAAERHKSGRQIYLVRCHIPALNTALIGIHALVL